MSRTREAASRAASTRPGWKQNPDAVRRDILRAARVEFAQNGFAGGRVDEIAAKTRTSKRMIYYYFGDKRALYRKVLEEAYRETRAGEEGLEIEDLTPVEGLRKIVEYTFDHHRSNPDVVRLIMIENIHHGQTLAGSEVIKNVNESAIDKLADIYQRGCSADEFRAGITPLELHWQISALCFFNISNQWTFSLIFGDKLNKPKAQAVRRSDVVEMVERFVRR